eukprot:Colp12_sorted_trinity150504_noHs@25842
MPQLPATLNSQATAPLPQATALLPQGMVLLLGFPQVGRCVLILSNVPTMCTFLPVKVSGTLPLPHHHLAMRLLVNLTTQPPLCLRQAQCTLHLLMVPMYSLAITL